MKTLTVRQFATVKRVAQNVNPLVVKKNKIAAKIDELNAEYNALTEEIEGHEMGIKALTGGYISEDLVTKKVEDTGKLDKDGKPIKVTKYEPREDVVVFNEEANVYEIRVDEPTIVGAPLKEAVDLDINSTMDETECEAGTDPMNLLGE